MVVAGVAVPLNLILHAFFVNGFHSFPLDDPWIHLTYARVLAEHGEFAYFPGDPSTQGSTAPLYTLLVAAALKLASDEKLVSFAVGLAGQALFVGLMLSWATRRLGSLAWGAAAVLLIVFDGRVGVLAAGGMETSWFMAAVAAVFCARAAHRHDLVALSLAVALWLRPDALILAAVLAVDALLRRLLPVDALGETGAPARRGPSAYVPAALLALAWFGFNRLLGGAWLPNTFAAKTAYYRARPPQEFLVADVWGLMSSDGWRLLLVGLVGAAIHGVWQLMHRRRVPLAAEIGWCVALPIAYLLMLPFAHRFYRYLVPLLPALAIVGLAGLRQLTAADLFPAVPRAVKRTILVVILIVAGGLQLLGSFRARNEFAFYTRYHHDRHERAGRWLADNTSDGAIVAAHDIGAIAFYSGRKVVDIVGLVLPEAVVHLHTPGYPAYLADLFERSGVTHIAALRNWLEIDNDRALFLAEPEPELMEIFAWRPGRTHIVEPRVTQARELSWRHLQSGNTAVALQALARVTELDPLSARSWTARGRGELQSGQAVEAAAHFEKALALHPDSEDAAQGLELARAAISPQ